MTVRVAINGFGRMGRLALRAAWGFDPARPASLQGPGGAWGKGDIDIVHINEPGGTAEMAAHLMAFDSVHGRWPVAARADGADAVVLGNRRIGYSSVSKPAEIDWAALGVDLVLECSGKFKTRDALAPYYAAGVRKVVVSAPVKGDVLNVVMGVNATGRLLGTLLSGISYQWTGIDGCLMAALGFLVAATVFTLFLRGKPTERTA